ncbi:MAG: PEP-CTERM sorting domain-containing protein, partial [Planctomycetes bacterium]|nr:PEP-CTERM sorting domain-containing protein [Planctomycetota bacterium]
GKTIVGVGLHINAGLEGWVAHIPEPSTFILLALSCLLVGHRRR